MATYRDKLIRANFEAYRDLAWVETLEPRLREHGQDKASIEKHRQEWNEHTENEDWSWWQKESQRSSNAVLEHERMECIDRMDSLGMLRWVQDKAAGEREALRQVFGSTPVREEQPQERSQNMAREKATTRDEMICAHFDAHSELQWVTKVEPKFKAALWEAAEIEDFRDAWMALTEARDWDGWREKVNGRSDADLKRDIAEFRAQIDTFRKGLTTDRQQLRRIMECKDDTVSRYSKRPRTWGGRCENEPATSTR